MLQIETNKLAAAIPCASRKDIRYYLNGVHLEVASTGCLHIVSTDGHKLFAGRIDAPKWTEDVKLSPWSLTLPIDAVILATKAKAKFLELKQVNDDWYSLGDQLFKPVEGKFPDWRRVAKLVEGEATPAQFNPDYLVACNKALKIWDGGKSLYQAFVHHRGDSAGALTGSDDSAFCILMPVRQSKVNYIAPFVPADL